MFGHYQLPVTSSKQLRQSKHIWHSLDKFKQFHIPTLKLENGWFEDEISFLDSSIFSGELLLVSGSVYSYSLASLLSFVNSQKLEFSWLCCEIRPPKKKGHLTRHSWLTNSPWQPEAQFPPWDGSNFRRRKIQYWEMGGIEMVGESIIAIHNQYSNQPSVFLKHDAGLNFHISHYP